MYPQKGFQEGARNLAEPGVRSPAREALSRVLPRPKSPQETCFLRSLPDPSGFPFFPCQGDEPCFPEIQSGTVQSFSLPLALVSSPLFSW